MRIRCKDIKVAVAGKLWRPKEDAMKKLSLVFVLVMLLVIALVPSAMAQTNSSAKKVAEKNQSETVRYCRFLEDPVRTIDWHRGVDAKTLDLDWSTKAAVVSDTEMDITVGGGSGNEYSCRAPRGTAYVVDRMTRVAESVLICLNPVYEPSNWVVSGLFITKEDRLAGVCEGQMKLLKDIEARLGVVEQKLDDLSARPAPRGITVFDVEGAVRRVITNSSPQQQFVEEMKIKFWEHPIKWCYQDFGHGVVCTVVEGAVLYYGCRGFGGCGAGDGKEPVRGRPPV